MLVLVWFCIVVGMFIAYVVLDGFDLGAGAVDLLAARSSGERRLVLQSIGAVWGGNEVWLLAAAGTLYATFPALFASIFGGFYLPLMIMVWLLILRGIAIEFRDQIESAAWTRLWDAIFETASVLLAFLFGVALGNVVRGVPLNHDGNFLMRLPVKP